MITYDNGASWNYLNPPKNTLLGLAKGESYLHLHSWSDPTFAPFYSAESS